MRRYFDEPYVFRPPFRSTFWLRIARWYAPLHRRIMLNVRKIELRGVERIRQSLQRAAGILLTPNHWNFGDGPLVGALANRAGAFCYYLVSQHIFRQSRLKDWYVNRHGAFSVWREGMDRDSLRANIEILGAAERPIVIFPEGTWYRQNDRLGPLQQGVAMIALQAARQAQRSIVIHPVAIKYWLLTDPRPALNRRLQALESRFDLTTSASAPFHERIEQITDAWLASNERLIHGQSQLGPVEERRAALLSHLLKLLEQQDCGRIYDDCPMDRIWRLRSINAQRMIHERGTLKAAQAQAHLDRLLLCEHLFSHSMAYLGDRPSPERLAESVQRLEEMITDDFARPVGPMGVVVAAGPPIEVTADTAATKDGVRCRALLTHQIGDQLQQLLDDVVHDGPPRHWRVARWNTGQAEVSQ